MADEMNVQASYIQENQEVAECRENIPPGVSPAAETSKQKVQTDEVRRYSSAQPSGENLPVSDTCTFSTPAPAHCKDGVKKSRLSGIHSALTPILKYLNIGNKCPSPETLKQGEANIGKSKRGSDKHPNSDLSGSFSGRSLSDAKAPLRLLKDECLPDVTLFDVTCDSSMQVTRNDSALPDSVPATPVAAKSSFSSFNALKASRFNNSTTHTPGLNMNDLPESAFAPLRWLDDRDFPEITLLDVTRDSELSPGLEKSSMNVTQDISLQGDTDGHTASEQSPEEMIKGEEMLSTVDGNVTHSPSPCSEKSDAQDTPKASLELTRDISMSNVSENSRPLLEQSGQTMENIQTSADDSHPVNVTRDLSSSSDMSVLSVACDLQSNTSSKTVTAEPQVDSTLSTNVEELRTSCVDKSSSPTTKIASSANDTFTVALSANLSSSSSLSSTAQTPQNMTLYLPSLNVSSPKSEKDAQDLATSLSKSPIDNFLVNSSSGVKASSSSEVQSATFDSNSLLKSTGSSTLGENTVDPAAGTFCVQNNTFDTKAAPQQNGTITLSESSSSEIYQKTMDKPSSPQVSNATCCPKITTNEVKSSEPNKENTSTGRANSSAKMADSPECTFEADPLVENVLGAAKSETEELSQSDRFSDTSSNPIRDVQGNEANTFNLDETLDLAADALITSTPMPTSKVFTFHNEREAGKIFGATKKLYEGVPSKPESQVTSEVPSNIVCDRKTFLTKLAVKSFLPPTKTASHLLKFKPGSALPARFEPMTSGRPLTRKRTQAEALSTAASDASQATTGTSSSYNLRPTTTGSKQPTTGLRKYQPCAIPSGIQKATAGLRPPSAKSNLQNPAPLGTDKLRAPTAGNPVTKISNSKRPPLTRGEALQVAAKKRKIDAPLPCSDIDASVSSSDAVNKAKNLKQPTATPKLLPAKAQRELPLAAAGPACTTEGSASCVAVTRGLRQPATSNRALLAKPRAHGCANCVILEQQLNEKSEEIRRLKEELLKFCKEEEEC